MGRPDASDNLLLVPIHNPPYLPHHLLEIEMRIEKEIFSDLKEWTASITGLGIATLQLISESWIEILQYIKLEPAHWSVATMMACADTELTLGDNEPGSLLLKSTVRDF
jgi:hypothetical protein